ALQVTLGVVCLAHRVDPAPTERHIDGFLGCDRLEPRVHLMDLDPDLVLAAMVRAEPFVEALRVRELEDLAGIDVHRRHGKLSHATHGKIRPIPASSCPTEELHLPYLQGYPPEVLVQVRGLINAGRL